MNNSENNVWTANEGCFIVRKSDDFIMGEELILGTRDDINNYEDRVYTQEEYNEFYKKIN